MQYTKTDFFQKFNKFGILVKVHDNDSETGDFELFCPEEQHIAKQWQDKGYLIASVFEREDEDVVIIDNDLGTSHHKIAYMVLEGARAIMV